jgi:uncharacterized protein (TIGR04255 family)
MADSILERRYNNSPLIEVLFELKPELSNELSFVTLAEIYNKLKNDFPEKEDAKQEQIKIIYSNKGIEHIKNSHDILRLLKTDRSALVQVSKDFVTVHKLKPYKSWKDFSPIINNVFSNYKEIVSHTRFKQLGLRYINKISFKEPKIELDDYFNFYIHSPDSLPMISSFSANSDFTYENGDLITVKLTSLQPENDGFVGSILLDIKYTIFEASSDEFSSLLEKAHNEIVKTFESSITDKTRELFEEITE